jgi:hypothetical protein
MLNNSIVRLSVLRRLIVWTGRLVVTRKQNSNVRYNIHQKREGGTVFQVPDPQVTDVCDTVHYFTFTNVRCLYL